MKTDTEGGRMHRGGRDVLKDPDLQISHIMSSKESDPEYSTSWAIVAAGLSGINVIPPTISDFFSRSKFLLTPKSGGKSTFYKVPDKKCFFKGPTNCDDWLISNCHIINLGYGEDSKSEVVKNNVVWFAWDGFSQHAPQEIICRKPAFMTEERWREARKVDTWKGGGHGKSS